jgi:hypothetical protein
VTALTAPAVGGSKRAVVAAARKLAILLHSLCVTAECTSRSAARRWLHKFGRSQHPSSGGCVVAAERAALAMVAIQFGTGDGSTHFKK